MGVRSVHVYMVDMWICLLVPVCVHVHVDMPIRVGTYTRIDLGMYV